MNREEFYTLNYFYNASQGRTPILSDVYLNQVLKQPEVKESLMKKGYVDETLVQITDEGVQALQPYRVSGAVIIAADSFSHLLPISLEQPKGLLEVKGEKLIERLIQQLREAGIQRITVIVGYKKEMYFYLRPKYGVEFIENDNYLEKNNIQNNIYSLYLAKSLLENAYICDCDNYFVENPFNQYEYESFGAGLYTNKVIHERYATANRDNQVIGLKETWSKDGLILRGHSYWTKKLADNFLWLAEKERNLCNCASMFSEEMIEKLYQAMPPCYYKKYVSGSILRFDNLDELRQFDSSYMEHSHSDILQNICAVFGCKESDIHNFRSIHEGMTNTSFVFQLKGVDYIYRHPGEGTEKIISRQNERISLELMKRWNVDPTYIYMDLKEGWKISVFIKDFREPDYRNFEDSKKVAAMLRYLHSLPIKVDYGLNPWEDGENLERLIEEKSPGSFEAFVPLKEEIRQLYQQTQNDGVERCFCHGDTYKPNWLVKPDGNVILIDWEYAGCSDPGVDVGYYIVDAMYDFETARRFIAEYLGDEKNERLMFHFMAYTAIIAYYWFVWAFYRKSCGAKVDEVLKKWYDMAVKYTDYLMAHKLPTA
ncbi:MAG: phosphotransferase [Lachnospiraceae bacterium]